MTSRRAGALASTFVALFILASCGGSDDPPPDVASSELRDTGAHSRSLAVALAEEGGVEVEYQTAGAPRLLVMSRSEARVHEVPLPRLRAGVDYTYELRSTRDGRRSAPQVQGSFRTAALPDDLQAIAFTTTGTASSPLTFLAVRSAFTGGVVIDAQGQIVWHGRTRVSPQGAARRSNGNWVLVEDGLAEFSSTGEKVRSLPQARLPAGATIHHGVTATPRDTVLFLTLEPKVFASGVRNGESIWEWDPATDAVVKRWDSFDFLDPAVDVGARSVPTDWFHANSISLGQRGNAILSFHFLDQILSIAPDFGSIEWRLGGPGSTYAITPSQATSGQHSPREVAEDTHLLFDNGFARADGSRYSRALELKLNRSSQSVSTVWEYRPSPDIWASIISSVRRMPNGHSVVTFGTPLGLVGSTGPVSVHEVSPTGELLWKVIVALPSGSVFQGDPIDSIGGEQALP